MARYIAHVRSPLSPAEAFAYLADLRHFADWDPGVAAAEQVHGDGPAVGAIYELAVRTPGGTTPFRYEVVVHDPPRELLVRARTKHLLSEDAISVVSDEQGSRVTYDARLSGNGLRRLADPILALVLRRVGDRAAAGLVAALDGERADGTA